MRVCVRPAVHAVQSCVGLCLKMSHVCWPRQALEGPNPSDYLCTQHGERRVTKFLFPSKVRARPSSLPFLQQSSGSLETAPNKPIIRLISYAKGKYLIWSTRMNSHTNSKPASKKFRGVILPQLPIPAAPVSSDTRF